MAKDLFTAEWFPYYFERFEGSDRVAVMSLAEEGAYHRAIRIAWKFGSVPADSALLAARIGKGCTKDIADSVLRMFEVMPGRSDRMFHPTVEAIRQEQQSFSQKKGKAGRASAKKRWGFDADSDPPDGNSVITPLQQSDNTAITPLQHRYNTVTTNLNLNPNSNTDLKRLIERVRENFPQCDARIVEIGVLYTFLQRNGSTEPIRSIKYFNPEVEKMIREGPKGDKAIDVLLTRRREQFWETKNGNKAM